MSSASLPNLQLFPEELEAKTAWLEPFDWFREMRDDAPVRYDPARHTWDVFRYEDVKTVLDDDERFSVDPRQSSTFVEPEEPEEGLFLETMLFQDPPRHDELRSVVEDPFAPRAVSEYEPRLREIADGVFEEAIDGSGHLDVVEDVAYPFPVLVIAELLGIPASDRDRFKTWSDTLVAAASDDTEAFTERQQEIQREMAFYFLEQLEERRENPQDDLLTRIATAETQDGSRLSREEALGTCVLLLVAGNITTTNLIANAVRCFDETDTFDVIRAAAADGDERTLGSAIEECVRYRSPVQAMSRFAKRDVTLQGETIEAGDRLIAWIGSGNRDERRFPDADSFVPDRSPNQHLGFGHGTHYCLGAALARLEAEIALGELCTRLEGIELAQDPGALEPTRSSFIYGVESLPVEYERVRA